MLARPDYLPARIGLGELLLDQKRWKDLDDLLADLEQMPHAHLEAILLRGKVHLARQEFDQARSLLEGALESGPRSLPLLSLLGYVLLQQDRDHDLAEKLLLEILHLDPGNTHARRNLTQLRQHRSAHSNGTADVG